MVSDLLLLGSGVGLEAWREQRANEQPVADAEGRQWRGTTSIFGAQQQLFGHCGHLAR